MVKIDFSAQNYLDLNHPITLYTRCISWNVMINVCYHLKWSLNTCQQHYSSLSIETIDCPLIRITLDNTENKGLWLFLTTF